MSHKNRMTPDASCRKLECVISDLDSSLLSPAQTISAADLDTIHALKAQGIPFFMVTGRHLKMCLPHLAAVGIDYPIVCNNGATLHNLVTGENLYDFLIPQKMVALFWKYCKERGYLCYVSTPTRAYVHPDYRKPDYRDRLIGRIVSGSPSIVLDELTEDFDPCGMDVIKLMVPNILPEELLQLRAAVDPENRLEITCSDENFADVTYGGADKASAVRKLAEQYGFSLSHTLVMGDNYNDLGMLALAGYPVAPENAEPAVRQAARFITTPCQSSPLTHAIAHFFPHVLPQSQEGTSSSEKR